MNHQHNQHQHHSHGESGPIETIQDVFQQANFFELWSPTILLITITALVIYFLLIGPWKSKFQDSEPVTAGQKSLFISAILLYYLVQGTPINYFGHHYLFSAHMFQMAIVYLVMPPLLLLGLPVWFYRSLFRKEIVAKVFSFLVHPAVAIILFNFLLSMYHLPYIFDNMMGNHLYHHIYHAAIMVGAFLMWWPIVCPVPEMNTLTSLKKIAYLFIGGAMITPVCVLIIFASNPIYTTYLDAPQFFRHLPTLDDQQLGGVIMKVVQELSFITTIAIVFYKWATNERKKDAIDPLPEERIS